MTDEEHSNSTDERSTEDEREIESRDLDRIEDRVDSLHDELDKIKQTGSAVREDMRGLKESGWDRDMQQVMTILQKSSLLTERVERGDRNIVRGR